MTTSAGQRVGGGGPEAARGLAATGALTAALYLATLAFYFHGAGGYTRTAREVFIWLVAPPLLYLFYRGYRIVRDPGGGSNVSTVVAFAALFCVACALVIPFHSTDAFGYINRGWQQVHYGLNPYVHTVAETPGWRDDPMMREHWIYNPNPYGFLFSLLTRGLCALGGGSWWATLMLFKATNAAAYALTGWLVWSGAKRLGHERPALALYSFLWNPLVLLHHIANGHNDVLIGFALALAAYLAVTGRDVWAPSALTAAAMLKYAPVLVVPAALIYVFKRRGWKTAAVSCALAALVAALSAAPYLADWRQFRLEDIRDNATLIDNSLHSFLIHIYTNAARLFAPLMQFKGGVDWLVRTALRVGFLVFLAVVYWRFWRRATAERLVELSALVLLVLLCVVSSKFNGWYMAMALPTALLLPERHWLRRLTLLIACAQTLSLTFFKQAYMLNYFAMVVVPALIVFRQVRRERASAEPSSWRRITTADTEMPADLMQGCPDC